MKYLSLLLLVLSLSFVEAKSQNVIVADNPQDETPCPGQFFHLRLDGSHPNYCFCTQNDWTVNGAFNGYGHSQILTATCSPMTVEVTGQACNAPCVGGNFYAVRTIFPKLVTDLGQITWSSGGNSGTGTFSLPCLIEPTVTLSLPEWTCPGSYQWSPLPSGWTLISGSLTSRTITIQGGCSSANTFSGTITSSCGSTNRAITINRHTTDPLPFNHLKPSQFCLNDNVSIVYGITIDNCPEPTYTYRFINCSGVHGSGGATVTFDQLGTATVCRTRITPCGSSNEICADFTVVSCKPATGFTKEEFEAEMEAYPNPASSYLNIFIPSIEGVTTVKVVDISGRVVQELEVLNTLTVDVSNLPNGVYFLQAATNSFLATKKIEINR